MTRIALSRRSAALAGLLVIAAAASFAVAPAGAQTAPPNSYYGTAESASGTPAPEGTTIVAVADGEVQDSITVGANGQYGSSAPTGEKLRVSSDIDTTVTFHIDNASGIQADETDPDPTGEVEELDLTFPAGVFGGPTTVSTATPTPSTATPSGSTATPTSTESTQTQDLSSTDTASDTPDESDDSTESSDDTDGDTSDEANDSTESSDDTDGDTSDEAASGSQSSSDSDSDSSDSSPTTDTDAGSTAVPVPTAAPGSTDRRGTATTPVAVIRTDNGTITVSNASLNRTEVSPGDVVLVTATLRNPGETNTSTTIPLRVNDTEVDTQTHTLPPNETRHIQFRYRANRTGTFPVRVGPTSAGTLTVTQGGSLIPWGFLRAGLLFLVLPVALIYGVLKALAIYYGY